MTWSCIIQNSDETENIINNVSQELIKKYQKKISPVMRNNSFIFDYVDKVFYYCCNKISLNRKGSCSKSLQWVSNKETIISPRNIDEECFKYAVTITMNHKEIKTIKKE